MHSRLILCFCLFFTGLPEGLCRPDDRLPKRSPVPNRMNSRRRMNFHRRMNFRRRKNCRRRMIPAPGFRPKSFRRRKIPAPGLRRMSFRRRKIPVPDFRRRNFRRRKGSPDFRPVPDFRCVPGRNYSRPQKGYCPALFLPDEKDYPAPGLRHFLRFPPGAAGKCFLPQKCFRPEKCFRPGKYFRPEMYFLPGKCFLPEKDGWSAGPGVSGSDLCRYFRRFHSSRKFWQSLPPPASSFLFLCPSCSA